MNRTPNLVRMNIGTLLLLLFAAQCSGISQPPVESEEVAPWLLRGVRLGMEKEALQSLRTVSLDSSTQMYFEKNREQDIFFTNVGYRMNADDYLDQVQISREFSLEGASAYFERLPDVIQNFKEHWGVPSRVGTYRRSFRTGNEFQFIVLEWRMKTFVGKMSYTPQSTLDLAMRRSALAVPLSYMVWIDEEPAEKQIAGIDWDEEVRSN